MTAEGAEPGRVVLLSGGLGGARLAPALARRLGPGRLTVVVNVGDDVDWHGLRVCPDLDSVLYALAGCFDHERGWGIAGDTFHVASALAELGGPSWFQVGDLDLATHLRRTALLREGRTLTEVAATLAGALGVGAVTVLPAADEPNPTHLVLADGRRMGFQDWYVAGEARPRLQAVELAAGYAAPQALAALRSAEAVVIGPSNPVTSIGAVLALTGMRSAVAAVPTRFAVSPVVEGAPLSTVAVDHRARARRRVLATAGARDTPAGVARLYGDLVQTFVLDVRDVTSLDTIRRFGVAAASADLLNGDALADTLAGLLTSAREIASGKSRSPSAAVSPPVSWAPPEAT